MELTPGWKTSEFRATLFALLAGALVLFSVVTADEAQTLFDAVETLIKAVVGLVVAVAPLVEYIKSRTALKLGE